MQNRKTVTTSNTLKTCIYNDAQQFFSPVKNKQQCMKPLNQNNKIKKKGIYLYYKKLCIAESLLDNLI